MPAGVYERKPCMKTHGKTAGQHEYIRQLRADGATLGERAQAFGVARSTISAIMRGGEWNPGRGKVAA